MPENRQLAPAKPTASIFGRLFARVASAFRTPSAQPASVRQRSRFSRQRSPSGATRAYDAAKNTGSTDGWYTSGASQNAESYAAVRPMRERARDLKRNNEWIRNGCLHMGNIMTGDGIRPQCIPRPPQDESEKQSKQYQDLMRNAKKSKWLWDLHAPQLDSAGELSAYGLQRIGWDSIYCDGDVLYRRRWRRASDGLELPYQIEILEADYLPEWKNEILLDGGRIIQGIEFDARGFRVAYHLYKQHPGDAFGPLGTAVDFERVPARDIAHGYIRERPGQIRGVCQFSASIIPARNYDDCTFSMRENYRQSANMMAAIRTQGSPEDVFGTPTDTANESADNGSFCTPDGAALNMMAPGTVAILRNADEITFNNPQAPQGVRDYMKSELHGLCAGMGGLPYALVSLDMDGANYAVWRASFAQVLETCDNWRQLHYNQTVCNVFWRWHIEACLSIGALPGVIRDYPVSWSAPKPYGFDVKEEAEAAKIMMRLGLTSRQRAIRRLGEDPDVILAECKADRDAALLQLLVFDSDPNETNLAGAPRITEKAVVPALAE